jgi:type II secretion system protein C
MRTVLRGCLALTLACGAQSPPLVAAAGPAAHASAAPPPASGPGLSRSAVDAVLKQGLGTLLQRFDVDPERSGNKFHGWRIVRLNDPKLFEGVDLAPGDVVTSVNGFPLEHPEQAQTAFDSLSVSSELRVDYERNGEKRALVYPIVDDK